MIKRVSLVRLRRDLPISTCIELWEGEHAEIVRQLPGVLEYTVDVAREPRSGDQWNAIATVRFADEAAFERFRDPQVQERLLSTRDEFIEAVDVLVVDEHPIIRQEEQQ